VFIGANHFSANSYADACEQLANNEGQSRITEQDTKLPINSTLTLFVLHAWQDGKIEAGAL
jgi:hypothetical protein